MVVNLTAHSVAENPSLWRNRFNMPYRVVVPRPLELERKRAALAAGGLSSLQVITDFDHTITRFYLPTGDPAPMCHGIVEKSRLMSDAFREGYAQLWADQVEGRSMGTWDLAGWWVRSHDLMIDAGLRREWIPEMVSASGISCREGCGELFSFLRAEKIPILIVSAGLQSIILEVLAKEGMVTAAGGGVRVLANAMVFDDASGVLKRFVEPLVHSEAKDRTGLWEADYFSAISRKNVLILGDSLRDCDCLANLEGLGECIRIGFFDATSRRAFKEHYEATYDILLTSEGLQPPEDVDMSFVLELLASFASHPSLTEPSPGSKNGV